MSWQTTLGIMSVINPLAVAVAGLFLNWRWRKADGNRLDLQKSSEARETVAAALRDLTSGDVEDARNLVGTLRYGSFDHDEPTAQEVIRACYRLIWAVERAWAAVSAVEDLDPKVVKDATAEQLQWHLVEVIRNVDLLSAALEINDLEAATRRTEVVQQLQKWRGDGRPDIRADRNSDEFQSDLANLGATLSELGIPTTRRGAPEDDA